MNAFEDWNNSELAELLIGSDNFLEKHVPEGKEDTVWQWDRSDLIDYAYEYFGHLQDEEE
jgi:hypothetical protein